MGVAVVHTLFGFVVFAPVLRELLERGVLDSVGNDPMRGAVAWFVLFGVVLFLAGQAIDALEAASQPVPKAVGAGLLVLCVLGIVLMPASGFWLALPPAFAVLLAGLRRPLPA